MSTAIRTSAFCFAGALNELLYIPQTQCLPSWSCGLNLQFVQLVGGFWVFFLSHIAPGLQLWFYFHFWIWVIHWSLLLRLPWRTWVCPCEGQVWRWYSCLSRRGSVWGEARWWGERGYGDGSPHYSWLSSINLLPWLLAFLHGHFPPQSPSSQSLDLSLHSQQQPLPWDCSTIPKLQLPATMPSRVCMAVARTVWFSFHLGCFPLSLNVSPLTQTTVRMWGSDPCFSSPTGWGQVQSY